MKRTHTILTRCFLLACLCFAVLQSIAQAAPPTIFSVRSGSWEDPETWDLNRKPLQIDSVEISVDDTVTQDTLWVKSAALTVKGALVFGGENVQVDAVEVTINPGGEVRGRSGQGQGVRLWNLSSTPGTFRNHGLILSESGPVGGGINIRFPDGTAGNLGTIIAGDGSAGNGGSVSMSARGVFNGDSTNTGTIRGGDSTSGGDGGTAYANATISGEGSFASNKAGSVIEGGDSLVGAQGDSGGDAYLLGGALSDNDGLITAGDGCPGGFAGRSGTVLIGEGKIESKESDEANCTSQAHDDPPTGTLSGDYHITADFIDLVAENLTIGPLNNPPAVDADQDLVITLSPGGILDLTGITQKQTWFQAGNSITIKADTILMDASVVLSDIMSPAPTTTAGAWFTRLLVPPPTGSFAEQPGKLIDLTFRLYSLGNRTELIDYQISDSNGWISPPINGTGVLLDGGGVITIPFQVLTRTGGTTITLTASTQVSGSPLDSVQASIEIQTGTQLPAFSALGSVVLALVMFAAGVLVLRRGGTTRVSRS